MDGPKGGFLQYSSFFDLSTFNLRKFFWFKEVSLFPKWKNRLNNVWFRKIFNLRKIFAVPKDFLKSKIYCTAMDAEYIVETLSYENGNASSERNLTDCRDIGGSEIYVVV